LPLRANLSDLSPHAETLAAVVLGALLATVSGMLANHYEARLRRTERERAAALLFGEVLSGLRTMLEAALQSLDVGERWGPISRRMLMAARRELDIYERNRESLLDLRDAALRVDIHSLAVRIGMPLDGLLAGFDNNEPGSEIVRERAAEFLVGSVGLVKPVVERLSRLAHQRFDAYDAIFQSAQPGQPPRPNSVPSQGQT
jgi:hypothetical protein